MRRPSTGLCDSVCWRCTRVTVPCDQGRWDPKSARLFNAHDVGGPKPDLAHHATTALHPSRNSAIASSAQHYAQPGLPQRSQRCQFLAQLGQLDLERGLLLLSPLLPRANFCLRARLGTIVVRQDCWRWLYTAITRAARHVTVSPVQEADCQWRWHSIWPLLTLNKQLVP